MSALRLVPALRALALALAAASVGAAGTRDGVLRRESMAMVAVRPLREARADHAIAAMHVDSVRDGLQVARVHARAHAAQVIELTPVRDRTDEELVRSSMRNVRSEAALIVGCHRDESVPLPVLCAWPDPASVRVLRETRETLCQGHPLHAHRSNVINNPHGGYAEREDA